MLAINPLYIPFFPLGFVGFWAAICWVISLNGWRQLAQHFRAHGEPPAKADSFWMQAASMREVGAVGLGASYRGVLNISCSPAGLGLSVLFLFRVGHPPLLIPWSAIGPVEWKQGLFGLSTYCTCVVTAPDGATAVEIRLINRAVAEQIEAYQQLQSLGS
ncbi:hypothetical protein [Hymenobacter pini]|uniref:hypothetical protein n=1 Tax=Hymenobacter pini TaxID=2880879 RepID=UPI001CF31143|nr:hypothetical protein [Hymenobacter pini]MCA8831264.1 hypothetical protein [Hymenobacter pini]